MSQRSIIELNHDFSHAIDREGGRFVDLLLRALASGDERYWQDLDRYGVRRIAQCHHSEHRTVTVGRGGLKREYPIS
jgi:hypothetical protein